MKRLDQLHWIMLVIILILSFYLFLSPYEYNKMRGYIIRINRITGSVDMFTGKGEKGWSRLRESADR